MNQGKKRKSWRSPTYTKVRAQLLEWISQKTRVTILFSTGVLAGDLTGQLTETTEPEPPGFKVSSGNDSIIFCPIISDSLSIENKPAHAVIAMGRGESAATISPFVNVKEILKTLPVDDSHVN